MASKNGAQPKVEMETVNFTEKQLKHVNRLKSAISTAEAALQNFAQYLADEHDVALDGSWALGDKGFERPIPPTPPADNGTGGEQGQPSEDANEETQTPAPTPQG